MSDTKTKGKKNNETLKYAVNLVLTAILAFLCALCFRRSAGIIAMTPLSLLLCAASVFLKLELMYKCVLFGVTVFIFNTTETADTSVAIMFTALCLLAVLAFNLGFKAQKKSKARGISIITAGALLSFALGIIFVGNPITAIGAKNKITEYTNTIYPESENAALGDFEFSSIYYRYQTGAYTVDASSSAYPTETASITLGDDVIADGFQRLMERKICEPYILEITSVLREAFPDDGFIVTFDRFVNRRGEAILSSAPDALWNNICCEITISGIQSGEAMKQRCEEYLKVIDRHCKGYASLTFKSGIGFWQRRSVTVDKNHPLGMVDIELDYVNSGTTNFFNKYIKEAIIEN